MAGSSSVSLAEEQPTESGRRIILAAEELFALRGIDGVSLRQISSAAGSANNSAVHYHFGSKEGLVEAIFRYRLPQLISERRLLAAQCDVSDVRSRFSAHFLPVLHMAEDPANHYVTFVEQLQRRGMAAGGTALALPDEGVASDEAFRRDMDRLLSDLAPELRRMRITGAQLLCLHAAVDRELAVSSGSDIAPFDLFVSAMFDGITGYLLAPASDATRARVTAR